jgi:hypothetical protein
MKMTIRVLDYFKLKPEFLPPSLASLSVYVRPGELDLYADPSQWEYVARAFHPTVAQAAEVERRGYCERSLPSGYDWEEIGRTWYDHPTSVRAWDRANAH